MCPFSGLSIDVSRILNCFCLLGNLLQCAMLQWMDCCNAFLLVSYFVNDDIIHMSCYTELDGCYLKMNFEFASLIMVSTYSSYFWCLIGIDISFKLFPVFAIK